MQFRLLEEILLDSQGHSHNPECVLEVGAFSGFELPALSIVESEHDVHILVLTPERLQSDIRFCRMYINVHAAGLAPSLVGVAPLV